MGQAAGFDHAGRYRRGRGDRGAALVEFALLLPFLAILAFGTVDLGRAYELKNEATNMAREGAFAVLTAPCPTSTAIAAARAENPDIGATATVQVLDATTGAALDCSAAPVSGTTIKVVVTTRMTVFTPLVASLTGEQASISGTATVAAP